MLNNNEESNLSVSYLVVRLYSSNASGWNFFRTAFLRLILRLFRIIWA